MKELLEAIWGQVDRDFRPYEDLYYMSKEAMETDRKLGLSYLKKLSDKLEQTTPTVDEDEIHKFFGLHRRVLLAAALYDFDSYLLYVEWNREPEKKFSSQEDFETGRRRSAKAG